MMPQLVLNQELNDPELTVMRLGCRVAYHNGGSVTGQPEGRASSGIQRNSHHVVAGGRLETACDLLCAIPALRRRDNGYPLSAN